MKLNKIAKIINNKTGLFFEKDRITVLKNGIDSRIKIRNLSSYEQYHNIVKDCDKELQKLVQIITINETYFFREESNIKLFAKKLVPELKTQKLPNEKLKILIAGCSTGEEIYSIVISLLENKFSNISKDFIIIGLDIDNNAIEKAQIGKYTNNSFRKPCEKVIKKYFINIDSNTFQIKDDIKSCVKLLNFNLLNKQYPRELHDVDIIFYRNVSIYFDLDTKKNVFLKLCNILNHNGYIFVGTSETFLHDFGALTLIERDGNFIFNKKSTINKAIEKINNAEKKLGFKIVENSKASTTKCLKESNIKKYDNKKPENNKTDNIDKSFKEIIKFSKNKEYDKALEEINSRLKEQPSFGMLYVLKSNIMFNLQKTNEAIKHCHNALKYDPLCLEAYLFLGIIEKHHCNYNNAINLLKKAIYIQYSSWVAHYYLGEIYTAENKYKKAYDEYKLVIKLLKKQSISKFEHLFFPLAFEQKHFIHLCDHNMNKLKEKLL